MPRKSRIDAPGALHHIIVRGIERRKIFVIEWVLRLFDERIQVARRRYHEFVEKGISMGQRPHPLYTFVDSLIVLGYFINNHFP